MEKQTKLKIFDFLSYGSLWLLGIMMILFIIAGITNIPILFGIGTYFIFIILFFTVILWISMIIVCIATDRVGYLIFMLIFVGIAIPHLFYFKVYRKTLKNN